MTAPKNINPSSSPAILITGGAGFVGSHVNKMLNKQGYQTIVLDDLSAGSSQTIRYGKLIRGNIADKEVLKNIFEDFSIQAVMHFAAFTDVGESVCDPARYYRNNVVNTIHLLDMMHDYGIGRCVFSSSAAIFGFPQSHHLNEEHPCLPVNPYGETKLMVEKILQNYDTAYGIKSGCLRYFNAAGGDPDNELKNFKKKDTNLIPLALRSLLEPNKFFTIYGTDYPTMDGTCIRDYIHVEDLASAHLLTLKKLMDGSASIRYNLGNGNGFSVREVICAVETVTGLKLNIIEGQKRPGDPPILVADSRKARFELGWNPEYPSLEIMVSHAWQALQLH